jgi:hypothetical protein
MTHQFEKTLKAATQRVQAAKQSKEDERAKRLREEEAQVAKINTDIKDWNGRIAPFFRNAIERANEIIQAANVKLVPDFLAARAIQADRIGPPIPPLPAMMVTASRVDPKASFSTQLAGAGVHQQKNPGPLDLLRLETGLNTDGSVSIISHNYHSTLPEAMHLNSFEKATAENAIAELVEAVMSKLTADITSKTIHEETRERAVLVYSGGRG